MSILELLSKEIVKYTNKKNPRKIMQEQLIIGLGNHGKRYDWTRHNLGWLALDQLTDTDDWSKHHKANALVQKLDSSTVLLKPQTYMNESGKAIREYLSYHKGSANQIIVIHDDLDLDFGRIKITKSGGAAGNNGVKSIIKELKTQDFLRIRLGIKNKHLNKIPAEKFVLQPFSFFEKRAVKKWLPEIVDAIECLRRNDAEDCMNKFH